MASFSGGGVGGEDLREAAERMWGALDRMAAENPEQYKQFTDKQIQEGKEVMAAPEPVACLQVALQGVRPNPPLLFL